MDDFFEIINKLIKKHRFKMEILSSKDLITYKAEVKDLILFLTNIKNSPDLRFTILTDLFAMDFLDRSERFEVVYSLLSLKLNKRLAIKIYAGEDDIIPSITGVFNNACWYEREIYDMFGINFSGSHDMRRILTDYGFEGHPLRKDFPLTGYVQVKYDEKLKKVVNEPVKLDQEYRDFNFTSKWKGPEYILPGDEKAKI